MINQEILNHKIYQNLRKYNTYSYKTIKSISNFTISAYLTSIVSNNTTLINNYTDISINVLKDYLSRDLDKSEIEVAIKEFLKFPAIQVADHAGLFYDFTNFINNFMWNIALENNNIKYLFTCQCETVRAAQDVQNFLGPAFIEINENIYNIFNLSKNKLKNTNVAALHNCKFIFKIIRQNNKDNFPDILKEIISTSKEAGYAPDMFRDANLLFWNSIKYENKRKLICFDRRFFSDVVAENILKRTPIIEAALFDEEKRNSFLKIKNRIIQSSENLVLRNTTDFFYLKKGDELIPLKIKSDGNFYNGRNGGIVIIYGKKLKINRKVIYTALKDRILYPDLILSNIFGHILPNIIAIGGTSQLEYLPNIVKILDEFLIKNNLKYKSHLESKARLDVNGYGRLIGPSLIKFTDSDKRFIGNLNSKSNLEEFKQSFCYKKIGEVLNIDFWNYFDVLYERINKL